MSEDLEIELMKGIELWTKVINKNPENTAAYYERALLYGQLVEFNEDYELKQLADLKKARELDPTNQKFINYEKLLNRREDFFKDSSRKFMAALKKIEKRKTNS